MNVKCIREYFDTQFQRIVKPDEVLKVTEARGNVLINAGVATPTEVVTEAKKAAATRKKKEA